MMTARYSLIIVPTAGIAQKDDGPLTFSDGVESFSYDIEQDPYEFCLKAVKKLNDTGACSNFLIVGGAVQTRKDEKKDKFLGATGNNVPKAEVMRDRLVKHYKVPLNCIRVLISESNTTGNAVAVASHFAAGNPAPSGRLGLMVNFFRLARATGIFIDATKLPLIPISAESVVYEEEFENIKEFYKQEGFAAIISSNRDSDSEIKGISDRENGTYLARFR